MTEPICIAPVGDRAGAGALWSDAEKALYWTDINRFIVHRLDWASLGVRSWLFREPVTAVAFTDRPGTLIAALASKVTLWQPANGACAEFSAPEKNPAARLNEARADPAGFLWVGSMPNNVAPDGGDLPIGDDDVGGLYRVGGDGHPRGFKTGIGMVSSLAWTPDLRNFFSADTFRNAISIWNYDERNGRVSSETPFLTDFRRGAPAGAAVDIAGNLWNARYGGGCIIRVTPAGKVDRVVEMPVGNVTSCAFGGPGRRTLFITTGEGGNGPVERLAGSLYALEVDIPGLPEHSVRLSASGSGAKKR